MKTPDEIKKTLEKGVDVGNYIKSAKRWVCMGLPMNVTHWMPMPEPPEVYEK